MNFDMSNLANLVTVQRLEISFKEFRINDKAVSSKLAADADADAARIRTTKDAIRKSDDEVYGELVDVKNAIRSLFYAKSMKWHGDGTRLLPNSVYFEFMKQSSDLVERFNILADQFCDPTRIERLKALSKEKLGKLYDESVFNGDLRIRFSVKLIPSLLPAIPENPQSSLNNSAFITVTQGMMQAQKEAMIDSFKDLMIRVKESLDHLIGKVTGLETGETKRFYESVLSNVSELAAQLGESNIFNDTGLESVANRCQAMIAKTNKDKLTTSKEEQDRIILESREIGRELSLKLTDLESLGAMLN